MLGACSERLNTDAYTLSGAAQNAANLCVLLLLVTCAKVLPFAQAVCSDYIICDLLSFLLKIVLSSFSLVIAVS